MGLFQKKSSKSIERSLYVLYGIVSLFSLYVVVMYVFIGVDQAGIYTAKESMNGFHSKAWLWMFYPHIILGMTALLIGPYQLSGRSRRNIKLHKYLGRVYGGVILLNILCVPYLALYATGGTGSTIAFLILDLFWLVTTVMGIVRARQRRLTEHQVWIARSYAVTWVFVSFRLAVAGLAMIMDISYAFPIAVYLSLLINLAVVEWGRKNKKKASPLEKTPIAG